MAQYRPVAASEDSRHPSPLLGDQSVTDGVDALVDRVQLASSQPAFNPPPANTKPLELSTADDAVLLFREARYPPVDGLNRRVGVGAPFRPPFSVPETVFGGRIGHAADGAGTRRAGGALRVKSV